MRTKFNKIKSILDGMSDQSYIEIHSKDVIQGYVQKAGKDYKSSFSFCDTDHSIFVIDNIIDSFMSGKILKELIIRKPRGQVIFRWLDLTFKHLPEVLKSLIKDSIDLEAPRRQNLDLGYLKRLLRKASIEDPYCASLIRDIDEFIQEVNHGLD